MSTHRRSHRLFVAALAALLATTTACAGLQVRDPAATLRVEPQRKAPDFALTNHEGVAVSLQSLVQDATVIVVFYRGDWCPFCRKQLRDLARIHGQLQERHATLVAISVDDVATSKKLHSKLALPFQLLSDPNHAVIDAYGVLEAEHEIAVPSVFIVSKEQKILSRKIGTSISDRLYADELVRELDRLQISVNGS